MKSNERETLDEMLARLAREFPQHARAYRAFRWSYRDYLATGADVAKVEEVVRLMGPGGVAAVLESIKELQASGVLKPTKTWHFARVNGRYQRTS